jgi:hypothetical protein
MGISIIIVTACRYQHEQQIVNKIIPASTPNKTDNGKGSGITVNSDTLGSQGAGSL